MPHPLPRIFTLLAGLGLAGVGSAAAESVVMENTEVRLAVDPNQGGAVTLLRLKHATTFPFIAERGAGIAGSGALFLPTAQTGGHACGPVRSRVSASDAHTLVVSGGFGESLPGIEFERCIELQPGRAGFTMRDTYRNVSGSAVALGLGATSLQQAEAWRLADRTWIGDSSHCVALLRAKTRTTGPDPAARGSAVFWRQIGQYGTGFLYRIRSPQGAASITATTVPGKGRPTRVTWEADALTVAAGGALTIEADVLLDEGGGPTDQGNAFAPVLARADFTTAGRSGDTLIGFVTVVSPEARRVQVTWQAAGAHGGRELTLEPGKVARWPVTLVPSSSGDLAIRVAVTEAGHEVGSATAHALVDGDASSEIWRTYAKKMPEEYYQGTWREIGRQFARNSTRIKGGAAMELVAEPDSLSGAGAAEFSAAYPHYFELLEGAAEASGGLPARYRLTERKSPDRAACMDVAFYGPDGPINAYSKERDGPDFQGLGYVQVRPDQGYPFHIYMHFGINGEGLSTSGASLNEDAHTDEVATRELAEWRRQGKPTLSSRVGMWMLLAQCRNVEEALAMIENARVPMEFTIGQGTHMLLLDRAGHAARVEGVGLRHQIFRRRAGDSEFYVAGNYPHESADGLFRIGRHWGHAANSMLRQRFLQGFAGERGGQLSLEAVMALMQSHEAGGMCQHGPDNPGPVYTCCSYIAMTRTGDLWLAEGPPCQVHYVRHTLAATRPETRAQ